MQRDNAKPFDGGPAYPSLQPKLVFPADDNRPYNILQQPMNGMSVRDVATLQILSALIAARCTPSRCNADGTYFDPLSPEWIVEAMDAADAWLELRGQV